MKLFIIFKELMDKIFKKTKSETLDFVSLDDMDEPLIISADPFLE